MRLDLASFSQVVEGNTAPVTIGSVPPLHSTRDSVRLDQPEELQMNKWMHLRGPRTGSKEPVHVYKSNRFEDAWRYSLVGG